MIGKLTKKAKFKLYNEKHLIFLLILISVITVFIILMNLPSDLQKKVQKESIKYVFVPEVENKVNHEENHQHPAPPFHNSDNYIPSSSIQKPTTLSIKPQLTIDDKQDHIKKVFFLILFLADSI